MNANRIWGIVTAFVVVLVLALGWFLGVSPLLDQASRDDEERSLIEGSNASQQLLLDSLKAKAANVEQYTAELAALRSASIPASPDYRDLFVYLEEVADDAGVTLLATASGGIVQYAATPDNPVVPAPQGRLAETLYYTPINLTMEGSAEDILDYVHRLQFSEAAAGRLLIVPSFSLTDLLVDPRPAALTVYAFFIDDPNVPASVTDALVPAVPEEAAPEEEPAPEETPAPEPTATP